MKIEAAKRMPLTEVVLIGTVHSAKGMDFDAVVLEDDFHAQVEVRHVRCAVLCCAVLCCAVLRRAVC